MQQIILKIVKKVDYYFITLIHSDLTEYKKNGPLTC